MMLVPKNDFGFNLFTDFFSDDDFLLKKSNNLMKTDIKKAKDKVIFEIDLPGYEKENIDVSFNNGYLVISAKIINKNNSNDEKILYQERFFGQCSRSFYVGEKITMNDIGAEFKNGILKIVVSKVDEANKELEFKHIEIK